MIRRNEEIETVPHELDASLPQHRGQTFASSVANFFRRNEVADVPAPIVAKAQPFAQAPQIAHREGTVSKSTLYKHWDAINANGITASEFIAFLQPLADLDGITVSYTYSDEDGREHVYNRRREDVSYENPLSQAIREKKLSREKALSFALNEQGKVWVESNFIELK
jgi:hypothetical protein